MACDKAKRIAELNDQLRARIGVPSWADFLNWFIILTLSPMLFH